MASFFRDTNTVIKPYRLDNPTGTLESNTQKTLQEATAFPISHGDDGIWCDPTMSTPAVPLGLIGSTPCFSCFDAQNIASYSGCLFHSTPLSPRFESTVSCSRASFDSEYINPWSIGDISNFGMESTSHCLTSEGNDPTEVNDLRRATDQLLHGSSIEHPDEEGPLFTLYNSLSGLLMTL